VFELILYFKPQDLADVARLYSIQFLLNALRSFFGGHCSEFIGSDSGFGWSAGTETFYGNGGDS
jgi:hypothetical protein